MNELLELQTGQVPFISGLMAGFSLAVAVQIMRSKDKSIIAIICFLMFTSVSLLFLISLYIDVALNLRVVGIEQFLPAVLEKISSIRAIGTSAATTALFLFVVAIGLSGWLHSKISGILGCVIALLAFITIWIARGMIFGLGV